MASFFDLRTRQVPDKVWLLPAPLSAALTALWLAYEPWELSNVLLSLGLVALIGVLGYYSGLMGGADAKALFFIAISTPIYRYGPLLPMHPFPPVATFSNALALSGLSPIYMLVRNLAWRLRTGRSFFEGIEASPLAKALALLAGYKMRVEELREAEFVFPMEVVAEEGGAPRRKLVVFVRLREEEELFRRAVKAVEEGTIRDYIWVSPGLPLVFFITVGYLLALAIGDLLFYLVFTILGLFL